MFGMGLWQERSKRKPSGGKYHKYRDKRKSALARQTVLIRIADTEKRAKIRTMGGGTKVVLKTGTFANVADPKAKKIKKTKILGVLENPASRHYTRMNVITKGSILDTELGKVRVTNSPGQEGVINAVLLEKKAPEPKKVKKKAPAKKPAKKKPSKKKTK
jgi:small subunit ribosomal protein S8e